MVFETFSRNSYAFIFFLSKQVIEANNSNPIKSNLINLSVPEKSLQKQKHFSWRRD